MKKTLLFALVFCVLFSWGVQASVPSYSQLPDITSVKINDAVEVSPKTLNMEKTRATTIKGVVPSVTGSSYLSNQIEKIISMESANATYANASDLTFNYKIVQSDSYDTISFLISSISSSGSSMDKISTVVVDRETLKIVKPSDLLGGNGNKIATSVVNNYIAAHFKSMPRISGISDDANFYVTDDAVCFVFDKYEIAPGSEGIQTVPVYYNKIKAPLLLEKEEYHSSNQRYNVRMLPLRKVAEYFGFNVSWNSEEQSIDLKRNGASNGEAITVKLHENAYKRADDLSPQVLESAPEVLEDGLTYVPISFFESILDIYYNVRSDGVIELTVYEH